MSSRALGGDSENPSAAMEIEARKAKESDGFLRDSQGSSKSSLLRNAVILIVVLLAISLAATGVFGSTAGFQSSPKQEAKANEGGRDNNKVDLTIKNPERDGFQYNSPSCEYTCQTDKLPHESPLYAGQVLCNQKMRFGLTKSNDLFIQDCEANVQTILWSAKEANLAPNQLPVHFEMKKNGYFEIISDPSGKVLFESRPKADITYHEMCLHRKPKLDCPYLSLHKEGVLILNWIQEDPPKYKAVNVQHNFDDFNPNMEESAEGEPPSSED